MELLIAFAALGVLSCAPAQETGAAPPAAADGAAGTLLVGNKGENT